MLDSNIPDGYQLHVTSVTSPSVPTVAFPERNTPEKLPHLVLLALVHSFLSGSVLVLLLSIVPILNYGLNMSASNGLSLRKLVLIFSPQFYTFFKF